MTDSPIERAAIALWHSTALKGNRWEDEDEQDFYRERVRIVVQALYEPNESMEIAGAITRDLDSLRMPSRARAGFTWRSMIKALLAEGKQDEVER